MKSLNFFRRLAWILASMQLLAGCAAQWRQFEAKQLAAEGNTEAAALKLEEAAREAPRDATIRRDFINRKNEAIGEQLDAARGKLQAGDYVGAETFYRHALKIDHNLSSARSGLNEVEQARRLDGLNKEATKLAEQGRSDKALALANRVIVEKPDNVQARRLKQTLESEEASSLAVPQSLNALYAKPISLEFRDVPIQQALEALARTTNINFVFDKEVRPDLRATLFLRQTLLEDAVNQLLASNRLEKKILNERSVLIYPADPAKTKEYQDLVVRAFYLDHGDAKQLAATLKSTLKIREAVPDERLNMILIRDTPEAITVAERVIALYEIPDPEVMLEVEVLEVTRAKLMDLGIQWPSQATFTPLSATGTTTTTLADLKNLNDSRIQVGLGSVTAKLNKTDSDVNLLANPRIRVRNKTKAKILIGDKVPVITTTSTATGFVSESVQYVDVGLKLEVEPRVALNDDVSIKIALEVSSLVKEVRSGGTLAYQIGTRNADTFLTLRDGETQILAGLLNDEERSSGNRIPFLGDIPLLGRLFGSQRDERAKTEIILSITPRIVQNARRPPLEVAQFWSGTEATLRTRSLTLPSVVRSTGDTRKEVSTGSTGNGATTGETAPGKAAPVASTVEFAWKAPTTAKVGETVTVALHIKTDGAIRSLPFQVGFDPASVDIVKLENGGFFRTDTGQANLSTNIDSAGGRLFASLNRSTDDGPSGEGMVAIITVRAKSADRPIELKLLGATPIGLHNQVISPQSPAPVSIQVTP